MTDDHRAAEALAQRFHEAYERLAPSFGYATREASAKPWADVPEQNRRLMIAVCAELLGGTMTAIASDTPPDLPDFSDFGELSPRPQPEPGHG